MKTTFLVPTNLGSPRTHWRFNPLRELTPRSLSLHLDNFAAGHLRETAIIFDLLEERDDLLRGVISKRKKSVARHGWTVVAEPNLPPAQQAEAREHAAALDYFYSHLECESAVDRSTRGGFKLLARQMMDAVGKGFAVHEIVWKRENNGATRPLVTARFRFVPLWFFENRSGELKFTADPFAGEGAALEPGAWMVTRGEGLMPASATAWMLKNIALDDWMKSCERNGTPAVLGIATSGEGTADREALVKAIESVRGGNGAVIGAADQLKVLDLMGGGHLPYPELVERIDRLMASLWRGADLSTLSRDRGYGASLQEKEACALEEDDAEMITETLNRHVDEWVIKHLFGAEARPLARVKVLVSPRECTQNDLQVDEFLLKHGAPLAIEETMRRYGRAMPKAGQAIFARGADPSLPASSHRMPNEAADCCFDLPGAGSRGCSTGAVAALGNASSAEQGEWLQLAPYGEFPHARGLQRVDRAAAEGMVHQFHSFRGRAGRLFGGVPFYVGHPDLPGSADHADRKAYGWVEDVEAREDGFYGRVKWSDAGLALVQNAHFKYCSPFWEAREIAVENGRRVFRPVALLSVGLTNQPNIPVRPLANEADLGMGAVLPADVAGEGAQHPSSSAGAGRTSCHERSVTEGLGRRCADLWRSTGRGDRIQDLVRERMRAGMNYDEAWERVKREHAALFEE